MTNVHRVVLAVALLATTALTILLGITDPREPLYYPTRFLVWNLFLAWIPMVFAVGVATVRSRALLVALVAGWLAFLPNAPYLVTDLVHLREGYELWRHVLQYGFAAWTGIILGVVSMLLVHRRIERAAGDVAAWALVAVSVGLCAIGIVIGRFQRWNSWDLVTRPDAVAATTLDWVRSPFAQVESTGVALAVAAFFGLAYLTVWALSSMAPPGGRS
ncbi:MAG: DUF1361 domain-containing protein [Thermoleophilia bacterium]